MDKISNGDLEGDRQPPAPDQGRESNSFFKCASSQSQFVRIMNGVSMQFKGSLVDPLFIKAKLFKMMQSV